MTNIVSNITRVRWGDNSIEYELWDDPETQQPVLTITFKAGTTTVYVPLNAEMTAILRSVLLDSPPQTAQADAPRIATELPTEPLPSHQALERKPVTDVEGLERGDDGVYSGMA